MQAHDADAERFEFAVHSYGQLGNGRFGRGERSGIRRRPESLDHSCASDDQVRWTEAALPLLESIADG